jgi:flagellar M-ring protein FliF
MGIGLNGVTEFLTRLGPGRIAAMGAVTLALVGFFAFMIMRASQPNLGILYSDLQPEDATSIAKELDARGVTYELRGEGKAIAVPKADIARLRMDLAAKGIPSGGSVGYEIFDKGDAFSSTSFVQGVNALRALEGELARTIRSISRVQNARVHLVIPERKLFERDRQQARASIALKVSGDLEQSQVNAIRHLVASAVEGLRPENISIVDERGRLLANGGEGDNPLAVQIDEKQVGYERRLKSRIEEIVASVVGEGRTRVEVAAEFDQNRIQQTTESFDPESRVVRSTQTRNESAQTTEGKGDSVSVGNELPGAPGTGQNNAPTQKDASNKTEEIVNYEMTKTTKTEMIDGGRLKRVSVAVLVDGAYTPDANGQQTYTPRQQDELDRIATLVRSAMGYDQKRGDQVEVVNLRFAELPPGADAGATPTGFLAMFTPTKDDVMKGIELFVLALMTLVVTMVVVRPLVKAILAPFAPQIAAAARAATGGADSSSGSASEMAALGAGGAPLPPHIAAALAEESPTGRMMDIARVNGQVQAKSIERIGQMVKENTNGTVTILRQWIHEGS